MNVNDLIKIGFTVSTATDLSDFYANVAYLADFTADDLVDGAKTYETGTSIGTVEALNTIFKADTQYYKDIAVMLAQKGNAQPNMSGMKNVILFQKTTSDADFAACFNRMMLVNANFSQLTMSSRDDIEVEKVATAAKTSNRLAELQVSSDDVANKVDDNVAQKLKSLSNDNVKLSYAKDVTNPVAAGICSIQASAKLGGTGDIYSSISNVFTETYDATTEGNLQDQNVSFYTVINPVNGGGVEQYGKNFYFGGSMINGESAKRRRVRYFLDIQLKGMGLDFLQKKLNYEDLSCDVLESMIAAIFIEAGNSGQVARDAKGDAEFYVKVLSIAETRSGYISLYNAKTYKVVGWYRDALTGEKIEIDLAVDPSDTEKSIIEMAGA